MSTHLRYLIPDHLYNAIFIFLGIVILYTLIGKLYVRPSKWRITSGILFIAFWVFLLVVFTIFNREPSESAEVELRLFWCVKEAWEYKNADDWYFVVGNILLFIPSGVILPMFFTKMDSWWKVVLVGFFSSLAVEITQLIFHLGLFELDDLFHNTLGAYLGYGIYLALTCIRGKNAVSKAEWMSAAVVWIAVVAFFSAAVFMGQPVFSYFIQ